MSPLVEGRGLALPGRLEATDLCLGEGEVACLVGPNGGGKTSLLHALAGIGAPSGTVMIAGADLRRSSPAFRPGLLTFLPAGRDLGWPLLARDVVLLGGAGADQADRMIEQLELGPVAERRIDRLSTGERSRVLLARALAPAPRLLLLDEPTANLDPLWRIRVMDLVRDMVADQRQAALVAIHDLDAAGRYGDRILVVDRGRMVADGDAGILDSPIVARTFGVERREGEWRPLVSPPVDRRSSP